MHRLKELENDTPQPNEDTEVAQSIVSSVFISNLALVFAGLR